MFDCSFFPLPAAVVRPLLAFLLLAVRLPGVAQAPTWQSAQAVAVATAAGTGNHSIVTATAVDAAGNVFLAGSFANTVVLGTTTLTSLGSGDAFVAKFSPASNRFVWAHRAGGTGDDRATALAVSGTGVYAAGYFRSPTADFGPASLTNGGTGAGTDDVFVAKLTDAGPTGAFVWAQGAGGFSNDQPTSLAVSGASVYVAGFYTSAPARFGATTLANATGAGSFDAFVAKLTDAGPAGSFVWAHRAGGTGNDVATALAVRGTGVYAAGHFSPAPAGFGPFALASAGANDVFVAKFTDAGSTASFVWAQQAGGTNTEVTTGLAITGTGVFTAGYFYSPMAGFGPLALTNPAPNAPLGFLATLADPATPTATGPGRTPDPAPVCPNPARGTASLRLPAGATPAPLTLTDARGRAMRHYPAPAGLAATLDLRGLPPGLYLLHGAGPAKRVVVE